MRHGCRESPDGLQGRTLGAGLRGGGVREGSPTLSGPYVGQAFLVPFCGGGLPPFDKRDSPEGAKQKISADSVRRATPSPQVSGLFPFGPAQALFAMEPRPAFAGMTGWRSERGAKAPTPLRKRSHNPSHMKNAISPMERNGSPSQAPSLTARKAIFATCHRNSWILSTFCYHPAPSGPVRGLETSKKRQHPRVARPGLEHPGRQAFFHARGLRINRLQEITK
ncbi:hypothetical protein J2T46_006141 [Pseudomonas citronellolis]|nr:hypothetical protein [Pseudomonas citronellolis]MCP1658423.1 hypothetical protein [Pseudomonas citronellolis]MCP1725360.1 hypothetical protein [Pseudomonas citronellolis]